ncbi:MAG: hypothetical protein PHH59_14755 [Methylovulum sp.]|uniref:hypothetical protein n=1 Tax=Methylovulum sp. TaxID=1916980 RepID=UPI00260F4387|nr:hypothetical protein [Methylovulum sp.]MDD2725266.1 hypothetical protein [Methylovulum sp.]
MFKFDANELPNGLIIHRRKGSKTNLTSREPRLRQTWDDAKKHRNQILSGRKQPHPIKPDQRWIFISDRTGNKATINGLKTAIERINGFAAEKAKNEGIELNHFTFHDLKRKGISDAEGDKMKADTEAQK